MFGLLDHEIRPHPVFFFILSMVVMNECTMKNVTHFIKFVSFAHEITFSFALCKLNLFVLLGTKSENCKNTLIVKPTQPNR